MVDVSDGGPSTPIPPSATEEATAEAEKWLKALKLGVHSTSFKLGEPCAVCKKPVNFGQKASMLACEHVVHQDCWVRHNAGYAEKIADRDIGIKNAAKGPHNKALRCPICDVWHGPNGDEDMPTITLSTHDRTGHRDWKPPTAWWSQPTQDLMHQVIGYIFQRHCIEHHGREGETAEEAHFASRCRNRMGKAKGGMQQFEALDAKIKVLKSLCEATNSLVPPQILVNCTGELVAATFWHLVDTKKGKIVDQKQFDEWMKYMRPWLITAGLTSAMIDTIDLSKTATAKMLPKFTI